MLKYHPIAFLAQRQEQGDVWMRLRVEGGVTREIRADGSMGWEYEHEFGLPTGDFVIARAEGGR